MPKGELKVGDQISINFSLKKISRLSVATKLRVGEHSSDSYIGRDNCFVLFCFREKS